MWSNHIRCLFLISHLFTFLAASGSLSAQGADPGVRLRAGDGVRIEIADEAELTRDVSIGADGTVLLPRIGAVAVAGRAFGEVRDEVARAYARELIGQAVRVTPLLRIAVLGEVRAPGLYPVDPTFGISEVLALAGGLTSTGDPRRVVLWRNGTEIRVATEGGGSASGAALLSGDRIIVRRQAWIRENVSVVIGAAASVAAATLTALILQ